MDKLLEWGHNGRGNHLRYWRYCIVHYRIEGSLMTNSTKTTISVSLAGLGLLTYLYGKILLAGYPIYIPILDITIHP